MSEDGRDKLQRETNERLASWRPPLTIDHYRSLLREAVPMLEARANGVGAYCNYAVEDQARALLSRINEALGEG